MNSRIPSESGEESSPSVQQLVEKSTFLRRIVESGALEKLTKEERVVIDTQTIFSTLFQQPQFPSIVMRLLAEQVALKGVLPFAVFVVEMNGSFENTESAFAHARLMKEAGFVSRFDENALEVVIDTSWMDTHAVEAVKELVDDIRQDQLEAQDASLTAVLRKDVDEFQASDVDQRMDVCAQEIFHNRRFREKFRANAKHFAEILSA